MLHYDTPEALSFLLVGALRVTVSGTLCLLIACAAVVACLHRGAQPERLPRRQGPDCSGRWMHVLEDNSRLCCAFTMP